MRRYALICILIILLLPYSVSAEAAGIRARLYLTGMASIANTENAEENFINIRDYIEKAWSDMGYSPQRQSYGEYGQNVYVVHQGTSDTFIVVGAKAYSSKRGMQADAYKGSLALLLELSLWAQENDIAKTTVFVAFGGGETADAGAAAFAGDIPTGGQGVIELMMDIDSFLAGDKQYIHSDGSVIGNWYRDMALALAEDNDTLELYTNPGDNQFYPYGTTGAWGSRAPFIAIGVPTVCIEASNWDIGLKDGSVQTEKHGNIKDSENDNIQFIETVYPGRIDKRLFSFATIGRMLLTME